MIQRKDPPAPFAGPTYCRHCTKEGRLTLVTSLPSGLVTCPRHGQISISVKRPQTPALARGGARGAGGPGGAGNAALRGKEPASRADFGGAAAPRAGQNSIPSGSAVFLVYDTVIQEVRSVWSTFELAQSAVFYHAHRFSPYSQFLIKRFEVNTTIEGTTIPTGQEL